MTLCLCNSEVMSSQPVHKSDGDGDGGNIDSVGARGAVVVESFTQPSRFDELIVGTQIPCTPGASQVKNTVDREISLLKIFRQPPFLTKTKHAKYFVCVGYSYVYVYIMYALLVL